MHLGDVLIGRVLQCLAPIARFLWDLHTYRDKVAVTFPNKLLDIWLVLSHSFPMSVKLETVIICMIAEEDIRIPGVCISGRFIGKIDRCFDGH